MENNTSIQHALVRTLIHSPSADSLSCYNVQTPIHRAVVDAAREHKKVNIFCRRHTAFRRKLQT